MIRTLIIDDEPLAIRGMKIRLAEFDDIDIVGTCSNGREAVKTIKEQKPDLVFLDIQMPGFDGFSVMRSLVGEAEIPLVVFVTAYDQYALDAFKAHAMDYLLKPVDEQLLAESMNKVREHMAQRTAVEQNSRLVDLIEGMDNPPKEALTAILEASDKPSKSSEIYDSQLRIKDRGHITIVSISEVEYIDAAGDYMCIHTGDKTHILRETMKVMEKRLDPKYFKRIHRSTIINLNKVKEVRPHSNGECYLLLENGQDLKVSRSYKDVVGRFL